MQFHPPSCYTQWQYAIGVKIEVLRPENKSEFVSWEPHSSLFLNFTRVLIPKGMKILGRILSW